LILILLVFSFFQQDEWYRYYEDNKIEISYSSEICIDKNYGLSFEYYLIRVRNKTDEKFVVNFFKGLNKDEENKIAFVLGPNEIKDGSCDNFPNDLMIFKSEISKELKNKEKRFHLTSIETIEVY
jgi:hypothetical protein